MDFEGLTKLSEYLPGTLSVGKDPVSEHGHACQDPFPVALLETESHFGSNKAALLRKIP